MGKKKQPTYRFVISEKGRDTQAKALEILGNYIPTQNPKVIELNKDRIKYWISVGAQTSNTVNNLLIREGVIEGKKKKSITITNKRSKKLDAKKVEIEEKKKAAEEKKQKEADDAKAAAEAAKVAEAEALEAQKASAQAEAEKPAEEAPVEVVETPVVEDAPTTEEKPQE
jgi:small subunit ribosomal protein S16